MAVDGIGPALDYLTDAAHLLRSTAPETSAHLMSHRGNLMFSQGMAPTDIHRQLVCGACGHIMIPGSESAVRLEARMSLRRRREGRPRARSAPNIKKSSSAKDLRKSIVCGRCSRSTKVTLEAPPPPASRGRAAGREKPSSSTMENSKRGKGQTAAPPMAMNDLGDDTSSSKTSNNASSKKRAKNRKASLQALLAGQQQEKRSPLSLADLMKR